MQGEAVCGVVDSKGKMILRFWPSDVLCPSQELLGQSWLRTGPEPLHLPLSPQVQPEAMGSWCCLVGEIWTHWCNVLNTHDCFSALVAWLCPNTSGEGGAELLAPLMPPLFLLTSFGGREADHLWGQVRDNQGFCQSSTESQQMSVPIPAIPSWQDVDF